MNRRQFITAIASAAAWPLTAAAQEPGRIYRIGVLSGSPRTASQNAAFMDELRQLGFVEGRNLTVDDRGWAQPFEQFPRLALDMIASGVDAMFCTSGDAAVRAAQAASQTVPIVGIADDMVASGLVQSLPRPGGNTTGISILAPELDGKRQEILMELLPAARRMAVLADPIVTPPRQLMALRDAVRARDVALSIHTASGPEQIAPAVAAAKSADAAALNVLASPLFATHAAIVLERAAALALPAMYQWPHMAEDGGLIAYGPRRDQLFRQLAVLMAKVLRGANPSDLPVEQPTRLELVINLKTAKTLGVDVPATLLARADAVVE